MLCCVVFQEEWISEEELYTEGSSDEDDMALRMKRREHRQGKREISTGSTPQVSPIERSLTTEEREDKHHSNSVACKQGLDDDSNKWRPTQGSFKLRNISDTKEKIGMKIKDSHAVGRFSH